MKRSLRKKLEETESGYRAHAMVFPDEAAAALATDAEVRRLRRVEKLAREFVELAGSNEGTPGPCERALRAALRKPRSTRRTKR